MVFDSFSIKFQSDDSCANLESIDKIVCEKLGLVHSEKDFGLFYFSYETGEHPMHQQAISWAGLIHSVVYYSKLDYGKRGFYELIGALVHIRKHYIKFPLSAIRFLTDLLDLLYGEGYYVYVHLRSDERDKCKFVNSFNQQVVYLNETGTFTCDEHGRLLDYCPSVDNLLEESVIREHFSLGNAYYKPCVKRLVIPKGVKRLCAEFFRGGLIEKELILPNTLESIGSEVDACVFANTHLPRVVLPDSLALIGNFAFGNSEIEDLVYPTKILSYPGLRQFKGARINVLSVPKGLFDGLHCQGGEEAIETLQAFEARIEAVDFYSIENI
ncbi:MAG: leucine-rich repeat protein [Paraprevotella sp.]|nr:leucine-rich repeat protein [Paraprevotella sp.]MBP3471693.1 leucine-rich repeat protein [Paraprevotella sp.]